MTEHAIAAEPQATAAAERREYTMQMSYKDYLAWSAGQEMVQAEWVDGEVTVFMPPNTRHQDSAWFLSTLIGVFVRLFDLGKVMITPFEMRLHQSEDRFTSREPDILFLARAHLDRLTDRRLEGPADLVIEIISPDSPRRDRADKFEEYQAAGVREYLLIDPRPGKERLDWYVLLPSGKYQAVLPDAAGRYHATVLPGLWLREEWLWQEPLPDPLRLLLEMPDAARALRAQIGE